MKEFKKKNIGNIYGLNIYIDVYPDKEIGFYIMRIYDETENISQGSAFAAIDSDKAYIQKKAIKEFKAIFAIVSKQILKNIEFQIEDNWLFKQKGRCNASAFLFW